MGNKIEVSHFTKRFGQNTVFDDVSIEFNSGNTYGLVGPNGSGKSVFLKCLCALMKPTNGSITYNQSLITSASIAHLNFGASIEKPAFVGNLSCRQNLIYLASINNRTSKESILHWMKRFEIFKYRNTLAKDCSLGTLQKLAIIQAIYEDQNVILLDEVTNSLDHKSKQVFYEVMAELKRRDKIIIYVNHSEEEIKLLCNRVYQIQEKRIVICENI